MANIHRCNHCVPINLVSFGKYTGINAKTGYISRNVPSFGSFSTVLAVLVLIPTLSWLILSKKKSISKKFLNFHLTFRDFCKGNYSQFHLRGFYFLHWLFDSLIEFFRSKFMKKFSGVNLLCKLFEMVLQQLFVYYFLLYIDYRKYGVGNSKKKNWDE